MKNHSTDSGSNKHIITYKGKSRCISEWARILGINRTTLCKRLNKYGWSIGKAIETPVEDRSYTKEERRLIKKTYEENEDRSGWLNNLAKELNRSKTNISRYARKKGWTKYEREFPQKVKDGISKKQKEWYESNEHPKGMLGKNHTEQSKKEMSKRRKGRKRSKEDIEKMLNTKMKKYGSYGGPQPSNPYSRTNGGKREDLDDQFFRSSWEANYARFLNFFGEEWEYEPKRFIFEEIKRGTRSYTPDFYIKNKDRWIEVKGWLDQKSKTRLKRFKKYYPEEFDKLHIVIKKFGCTQHAKLLDIGFKREQFEFMNEIKTKVGGLIKNWE